MFARCVSRREKASASIGNISATLSDAVAPLGIVDATVQICVATDLSESGKAATEYALTWARSMSARVLLVHIVHDPALAPALSDDVQGDLTHARAELEAVAADCGLPCEIIVDRAEDVCAAIVEASKSSDYLFVGSQGKSAFDRMRLGSVAVSVMRSSAVPVFCCPPPEQAC